MWTLYVVTYDLNNIIYMQISVNGIFVCTGDIIAICTNRVMAGRIKNAGDLWKVFVIHV